MALPYPAGGFVGPVHRIVTVEDRRVVWEPLLEPGPERVAITVRKRKRRRVEILGVHVAALQLAQAHFLWIEQLEDPGRRGSNAQEIERGLVVRVRRG